MSGPPKPEPAGGRPELAEDDVRRRQSRLARSFNVRRTPGISYEAVPASIQAIAGRRRHLRPTAGCGARVGAAEGFVSFIPLLGGPEDSQAVVDAASPTPT